MSGDALVVPIRVEALPVGERDTYSTVPGATAARGVAPYADFAAVAGRYAPYVGAQVVNRLFSGGRPLERGVHVHWHLPRALVRAVVGEGEELAPPPAPDRWLVARIAPGATAAWVVESNFLHDEPLYSQTTFPLLDDRRQFAYLGRVYTLADWLADGGRGQYHAGLHAFGYGIPDFAGCYANCRNVFGMRDGGLVEKPGTHTLTYVVVGWHHDAASDPLAGGRDPAELGWRGAGPGPHRTLYAGAIRDVSFDPDAAQLVRHQSTLTPEIAVGNTPAEALAALAARDDPDVERLFTAFQLGGLRRLNGVAPIEDRIHATGFAPVDAGVVYEIQAGDGGALGDLPDDLAPALSELNRLHEAFDRDRAELTTLQRRLFADFYRRAQLRAARWRPEIDLDALDELIEGTLAEIDRRAAQVTAQEGELDAVRGALEARLDGAGATLTPLAAPRYYRPNDPVLVLAGDGVAAPPPDAKDELACVLLSALSPAPALAGIESPPEAARLVALVAADGTGLPEPEIALRDWTLPWRAVELAWRVALQLPDALDTTAALDPDVVVDNYRLDARRLDFDPCDDVFSNLPDAYEGRAPLAANATAALELQLRGLIGDDLLRQLREKPLVVQALGGFTQALGMLDQGLQLPVADPFGPALDAAFVERVAAAVGDQARFAPLPENPFAPLRSGRFKLSALRLVDEFGRWRDVDVSEPLVSETIPTGSGGALLPPLRLTQAAQLRFRWRIAGQAGTDASSLPAASPVCGWIVPDHLDGGLILYGREGAALGRIVPGQEGDETIWFNPPEADDRLQLEEALPAGEDVLRGFALALDGRGGYLRAFAETLDTARASIAPGFTSADRELAVLLGEPLALVQAELDLGLLGLPLIDMSHRAFLRDIRRGDVLRRTDRGLPAVRFPVLLGNQAFLDDGLVGFFTGTGETIDYTRFHSSAAAGEHAAIVAPALDTVTVTPDAAPVVVTLLIDPRCPVHAATGILPVKSLAIPGDLAERGMAALDYTFLTGPLIVPADAISAPAPAGTAGWTWIDRGGPDKTWRPDELAPLDPGLLAGRRRIVDGWLRIRR